MSATPRRDSFVDDHSTQFRSLLLSQFEPSFADQLIEFGEFLGTIDADVLIFMARKSLCLYDILLAIGITPCQQLLASDRILDMDLELLRGKRVALVDDTLIVGTTLAKTKRYLTTTLGAQVSVHVFCMDTDWQVRNLIQPDTVFVEATDRRVMNFCASLVRAMSLVPRPYLVDFPLSRYFRIRTGDVQCFLSWLDWRTFSLSSPLQADNGVEVYTFLPEPAILTQFIEGLDPIFAQKIDITKVRAFGRYHDDVMWVRIVPIVTLRPMNIEAIEEVFVRIMGRYASIASDADSLTAAMTASLAKQRFIQFLLSSVLGTMFMNSVGRSIGSVLDFSFDDVETDRHYGPWLHEQMKTCLNHAQSLTGSSEGMLSSTRSIPTQLPPRVTVLAKEVLTSADIGTKRDGRGVNLIVDCCELFVRMYSLREIPAREEARRLGSRVLDAHPTEAPYRDRLNVGLPWPLIEDYLKSVTGSLGGNTDLISLALDACNDLGVAVPITCEMEGVVFRALRYGEDAPFGDAELVLAYEAVNGLLHATKRNRVPHLLLEKLLVFLLRAGVALQFLRPFFGQSGADGTARIGFNLKGAVVMLSKGPRDRSDRDIWLSNYLCDRHVLDRDDERQYVLGKRPLCDCTLPSSISQATQLGVLLGKCIKVADPTRSPAPLDDRSLIVLMTCCTTRHAAAALQVELDIVRDWFDEAREYLTNRLRWNDSLSLTRAAEMVAQSHGVEAIHSGRMKYIAYHEERVSDIIKECSDYLYSIDDTSLMQGLWEGTWSAIRGFNAPTERASFDPFIEESATLLFELGVAVTCLEAALHLRSAVLSGNARAAQVRHSVEKIALFRASIDQRKGIPSYIHKLARMATMGHSELAGLKHKEIADICIRHLDNTIPKLSSLIDRMEPLIERFGRLQGIHKYRYFIYYDVVDSTATHAALEGREVERRRVETDQMELLINRSLQQASIIARKQRGEIFCCNGSLESTNDSKHIFFSGKFAKRHMMDVVARLLLITRSYPGLLLRIHVLPCDFAGSEAFRYQSAPEVAGKRFWEHWSRVAKQAKLLEQRASSVESFLLVGTDVLMKQFALPPQFAWKEARKTVLKTEIAGLYRETAVRFGSVVDAEFLEQRPLARGSRV